MIGSAKTGAYFMHLIKGKYIGKKLPLLASLRAGSAKAGKHIKKHKLKYAAGAAAVTGFGFAKTHSKQEKKLKTYFGKLPKSDPRYKSLKKAGYV